MSNIVLSQSPTATNCILYPLSDNTTALQIFPLSPATHWDKVDDTINIPNDDTDYVFASTNSVPAIVDIYNISTHPPGLTGTINYVRVITRARAYPIPQMTAGEYKHKIICGAGTALSQNYAPVSTVYKQYSTIWTTNPATWVAWTWSDIDILKIGLSVSSPPCTETSQLILRPNAAGSSTVLLPHGEANNWACVDDVTTDEDSTYVYKDYNNRWDLDLYNVPNHTTESGIINSVTIYDRVRASADTGHPASAILKHNVRVGGVNYEGSQIDFTGILNYTTYSNQWLVSPNTLIAWTWAEIDSMEIGHNIYSNYVTNPRSTQIYAVINYTPPLAGPEIRTTQCYVMVNYIPNPSTVTLLAPNEVRLSNSRKTERFIFPDGTYCIGDYGRGSKNLSFRGTEATNAIQKMRAVQAFQLSPNPVTIAGLMDVNQDKQWRLKNFDFVYDIGGDHYDWTADFESYDYVAGAP
jgi:hypothetical protein